MQSVKDLIHFSEIYIFRQGHSSFRRKIHVFSVNMFKYACLHFLLNCDEFESQAVFDWCRPLLRHFFSAL